MFKRACVRRRRGRATTIANQDPLPHGHGARHGVVPLRQCGHGLVDLASHRFGVELVQVAGRSQEKNSDRGTAKLLRSAT